MDDSHIIRESVQKVLLRLIPKLKNHGRREIIATIKKRIRRSTGFTPVWVSVDRLERFDRQIAVMLTKEIGRIRVRLVSEMDKHTHQKLWTQNKAIPVRHYSRNPFSHQ